MRKTHLRGSDRPLLCFCCLLYSGVAFDHTASLVLVLLAASCHLQTAEVWPYGQLKDLLLLLLLLLAGVPQQMPAINAIDR